MLLDRDAVSILVVLDLALQLVGMAGFDLLEDGFNPCCIGFSVATVTDISVLTPRCCFNPCCIGFSVATGIARHGDTTRIMSFNPCCIGFSVAT